MQSRQARRALERENGVGIAPAERAVRPERRHPTATLLLPQRKWREHSGALEHRGECELHRGVVELLFFLRQPQFDRVRQLLCIQAQSQSQCRGAR